MPDTATGITREHYERPEVKEIITQFCLRKDGSWRAMNGDFSRWYRYDGKKARLLNIEDYDYITSHDRVLYSTLNVFEPALWMVSRNKEDITADDPLGTPADTVGYSLAVDIDKGKGFDIHNPEIKAAVEIGAQYLVQRLKDAGVGKSTWVLFSGAGIYIQIHDGICYPISHEPEKRMKFYERLTDCFNNFIVQVSEDFFKLHPEHIGKVKFDALNNSKRIFKTPLGIHKKHPYAVTPLDRDHIEIDFEKAKLPLKDEVIAETREWYSTYDPTERDALFVLLDQFYDEKKRSRSDEKKRSRSDGNFSEIWRSHIKIEADYFPPCMKYILEQEHRKEGQTRLTGILSTFLYQMGWNEDEAWDLVEAVSDRNGVGNAEHIFESCFGKINCPSCSTIKNDANGYPHLGLKGLGICAETSKCGRWAGEFADIIEVIPHISRDERVGITAGTDLTKSIYKTCDVLYGCNKPPIVFQRGGELVRVREIPYIEIDVFKEASMRTLMGHVALFQKPEKTKDSYILITVKPPLDIARGILSLDKWKFPYLNGIAESPKIRPDGSVLSEPGYDLDTGLYYKPAEGLVVPPIPDQPTKDDAIEAGKFLNEELLPDFPFVEDASRANAIAAMISPIIRPMIKGCVPIILFDKPEAGTGASLLLEIRAIITTGKAARMTKAPSDEEEMEKRITSFAKEGWELVNFDNGEDVLKSAVLASATTSTTWSGRILGQTATPSFPLRPCWALSGNGLAVAGDMGRRAYLSQLDAKMERPWERIGFKHENLATEWVPQNRGKLLACILTMARAWVVAGRPAGKKKTSDNFSEWTEIVSGILDYAGINGFLDNQDKLLEEIDTDVEEKRSWMIAWYRRYSATKEVGVTVGTVLYDLRSEFLPITQYAPADLMEKIKYKQGGDSKIVSAYIRKHFLNKRFKVNFKLDEKDEEIKGLMMVRGEKDTHANASTWKVIKIDDPSQTSLAG